MNCGKESNHPACPRDVSLKMQFGGDTLSSSEFVNFYRTGSCTEVGLICIEIYVEVGTNGNPHVIYLPLWQVRINA